MEEVERGEAIRRELTRLTALLHRHFNRGGADSLLPALADPSDAEALASGRQFLGQIRALAEALEADARRWSGWADLTDAFADFRRETLALLQGVEDRIAGLPGADQPVGDR